MTCLFCRIVAGEIPAKQVYADDVALAFLDINPWHRGHTLVIPRRHVTDVVSDQAALAEIAPAIQATAELLIGRLGADGINLLSNNGAAAGQEVFHLHVHLIPRFAATGGFAAMAAPDSDIDLDEVYQQISRS
ncbi:MAG: HIT family protein [Propionibacteriaceae bacterium]|nr:HIT family protein [Propionibacteriaceae bacterium]